MRRQHDSGRDGNGAISPYDALNVLDFRTMINHSNENMSFLSTDDLAYVRR